MVPALVITGHLSLVRSLGRRGVPVVSVEYSPSQTGHLSRYASESLRVPDPLRDPVGFVAALLDVGSRYKGGLLIPMFDAPLVACSKYKEELGAHYRVASDDWATTRIYLEKAATAELAETLGIPAPLSVPVESKEAARECALTLQPPFLVKPVRTHEFEAVFGSKMFPAATVTELTAAVTRSLDHDIAVMVQEFIPGEPSDGVVYAGYFANGEPFAETTHEKVRDGPPVYGSPRVVVSKHIPEIIEPGRALMGATGFTGFACVEFKRDRRDGVFKVMEVNARHNLAGTLHIKSGVDYPWIQYQHLVHGLRPPPIEAREGVYWVDIYRDLGYSVRHYRSERLSLREYARPYRSGSAFRTFDWHDPAPFVAFPFRTAWSKLRR